MGDLASWLQTIYEPAEIQELFADYPEIQSRFPEPMAAISELPPLPALAHLSLRGHAIQQLSGLEQFPALNTLILAENNLETATFGSENPVLSDIDLSDNPLVTLAFMSGHPVAELDISRTRLLAFPDLRPCTHLYRLTANGLRFQIAGNKVFPDSLQQLHMRQIRLSDSDWQTIPVGMCQLRSGAESFPAEVQVKLSALRTCYLHQLTQPVFLSMPNLEMIALDWFENRCQLETGDLPKLHTLLLPGCPPEALPDLNTLPALLTVQCRYSKDELLILQKRFPNISTWKPG